MCFVAEVSVSLTVCVCQHHKSSIALMKPQKGILLERILDLNFYYNFFSGKKLDGLGVKHHFFFV